MSDEPPVDPSSPIPGKVVAASPELEDAPLTVVNVDLELDKIYEADRAKSEKEFEKTIDKAQKEGEFAVKYQKSEELAAPINIAADKLAVNVQQINEIADQLLYITDCEVLKLVIKQNMDSLKTLVTSFAKRQLQLAEQYLPIKKPPTSPWGVVKWVGKLIFGSIMPQIEAYIKMIKTIIKLTQAVVRLVKGVAKAAKNLIRCAGELKDTLVEAGLNIVGETVSLVAQKVGQELGGVVVKLDEQLGGALTKAGEAIGVVQGSIRGYNADNAGVKSIDTSSVGAFLATIDNGYADIKERMTQEIETPYDDNPPYPILGLSNDNNINSSLPNEGTSVTNPITGETIVYRDGFASEVIPSPDPVAPISGTFDLGNGGSLIVKNGVVEGFVAPATQLPSFVLGI